MVVMRIACRSMGLTIAIAVACASLTACSDSPDEATGGSGATSSGPGSGASGGAGASGGSGAQGGGPGAGGNGGTPVEPDEPPELVFIDPPVDGLPDGVQFADAIPYGPEAGQIMDVFLPAAPEPTAVVFFIHGGGFVEGSSSAAYSGSATGLKAVLEAGIAWVGVDYRLLEDPGVETEGVIKSLKDSQRCLQFVRRWAELFHIDPERVGLTGGSAGAGTSLWLAYHDDMADPDSPNAWQRQSTRVTAASVTSTQATYDVWRWAPDIFAPTYSFVSNDLLLSQAQLRAMLVRFYGLDGALVDDADGIEAALLTDDLVAYRADVDMLALLTSDDPDTYVTNAAPAAAPTDADFDLLHHPLHAMAVRDAADAAGTVFEADIPAYDVESPSATYGFLIERLAP
jgi:acetyl esterase/lipase